MKLPLRQSNHTQNHKTPVKNGFSIIQVVVAIVIFGMTLSATVSLVGTVIKQVAVNKQRITAIYLAQECLELARNVRDSSWEQNFPWDCVFGENYSEGDRYTIESSAINPTITIQADHNLSDYCQNDFGVQVDRLATQEEAKLFIEYNRYTHAPSDTETVQSTRFYRTMKLSDIKKDDNIPYQLTVNCEVSWDDETIMLSEILSNWRKK